MLAINHTLTALLIAVTVKKPELVVPIALASHFVLDVIPHYGEHEKVSRGSSFYNLKIIADGLLSLLVVVLAINHWPNLAGIIVLSAFFSILPDLIWPLALVVKKQGPLWEFFKFHKQIQHESPNGIIIELIWGITFAAISFGIW